MTAFLNASGAFIDVNVSSPASPDAVRILMFPKPSVRPISPLFDMTSVIEVSSESVLRFLIRPSWPRTRSVVTAYSAVRHAMML